MHCHLVFQFQTFLQLKIVLSTKGIRAWDISLHDPNHLTFNSLKLYGKTVLHLETRVHEGTGRVYEIEPTEAFYVNREKDPCIEQEKDVKNILYCITDRIYQDLNCSLPWLQGERKMVGPLCSSPAEYDHFYKQTEASLFFNSTHIETVMQCKPACHRIEYSTEYFGTYQDPTLTEKQLAITLFFSKDKFPVTEQYYIYDIANFVADFGGCLGLLLGYSLLGFYDTLMNLFKKIWNRYQKSLCNTKGIYRVARPLAKNVS